MKKLGVWRIACVLSGMALSLGALAADSVPPGVAADRALLLSTLLGNIQDVFNEYGVQIMSPQYFEDPSEPKIVKPENWYAAPAIKPPAP